MKNFDEWNEQKKTVDSKEIYARAEQREIWWVSVGKNIGVEEDGKNNLFERPVLVFRVFNKNMFIGIPMTSAQKNELSNYYFKTSYKNINFFYVLPQIRLFSTKRLQRMIRQIEIDEFRQIKKAVRELLKINN